MGYLNEPVSFICDDNLGKLAKLLRALGYDTLFQRAIADGDLIAKSLAENRYLITRDCKLIHKGASPELLVLIKDDDPGNQLKYLLSQLGLKPKRTEWFKRCLDCNTMLEKTSKEENAHRIPDYVYKNQSEFYRCSHCDKLFWKGTHHQRMTARLEKLVPG